MEHTSGPRSHCAPACAFILCLSIAMGLAPRPAVAGDISEDWRFAATVYLWLPGIDGHSKFPADGGTSIDVDGSVILDHLRMVGMGSFSVRKERWGAFTDIVYLDLGASRSRARNLSIGGRTLPASVTVDTDYDFRATAWALGGSYRVLASSASALDLLAGARLARFNQTLEWQFTGDFGGITAPPQAGKGDISTNQWDAIVGIKGQYAFGADSQWIVPFYLDIGTGDSDFTCQGVVGLARVFGWGDVRVDWRYLDYDLKASSSITKVSFSGPALGFTFRW
jgi:hypothetical protein